MLSVMFRLVIALALLCGCRDKQLDELIAIKEEVCACKNAACGEAAMGKVPQGDIKSTHKMQQVARSMMDCMKRLYDNDRPTTDPDAEPSDRGSAEPASAKTP